MHSFANIRCNESIIRHMQRIIASGRVGHAFMFEGARGMGKKMLANAFAKTLQCERGGIEPCDACLSCRVFESGNHPDVFYVKPTKTKSIGVDDVREQIILPISQKPFRYRYMVFIIDNADTLTPQAQNALLKTIEEPALYGIFLLLTTSRLPILPTLRSRCVPFMLKPLPDATVNAALRENGVSDSDAALCAAFARGNIGAALEMASSEDFAEMRDLATFTATTAHRHDLPELLALYPRFEVWKESIQPLLDMLYVCFRDMIVLRQKPCQSVDPHLIRHDCMDAYETAKNIPLRMLFGGIDGISKTRRVLRHNGNFQLAIEMMLLSFKDL